MINASVKLGESILLYKDLGIYDLLDRARDKTLICFGAGGQLKNACEAFSYLSFFDRVDRIADNDKNKSIFTFRRQS